MKRHLHIDIKMPFWYPLANLTYGGCRAYLQMRLVHVAEVQRGTRPHGHASRICMLRHEAPCTCRCNRKAGRFLVRGPDLQVKAPSNIPS